MLGDTSTRVNISRFTARLSREITTQVEMFAPLCEGTHAQPGQRPRLQLITNHRLLASVAAWGEDVELAAAWAST
jgi:hypothetical protein